MAFKVVHSIRAQLEVWDVIAYLNEKWYPETVDNFLDDFEDAISRIAANPLSYPYHNENKSIRKYRLEPYHSIFFTLRNDEVFIISVFDMRQDPEKLKKILDE